MSHQEPTNTNQDSKSMLMNNSVVQEAKESNKDRDNVQKEPIKEEHMKEEERELQSAITENFEGLKRRTPSKPSSSVWLMSMILKTRRRKIKQQPRTSKSRKQDIECDVDRL